MNVGQQASQCRKEHRGLKTRSEIEHKIKELEEAYKHVLNGSIATVDINAPRALMQVDVENRLRTLYWVIGKTFKSKLNGFNK